MFGKPPSLRSPNVYMTGYARDGTAVVLPKQDLHWTQKDEGKIAGANVFTTNENTVDFTDDKGTSIYIA
jgi:hypothetical protein